MLELKDITKVYQTKDLRVEALKGINIQFRKSEFVSILGPSGCGKTTFLNIVGGLDKYTSGDLIINGKSTKDFNDRDWDSYRNHTIGFVFQSYNLIPHQTVLQNVELALTLSGISGEERKRRATEALEKVGLKDKLKSKPNQLSGGQMQRVAIARALVNDPDIVLADEPTGALDSKTSVQVMELLREIAKEKLVVMVTHNPSLADQYSTRIIKFLDGELVDDSNPLSSFEKDLISQNQEKETSDNINKTNGKKVKKQRVFKRTSMSFFTALGLSFKNLLTKKTRTLLVAFAGSIGIFGIALILALSSGFQAYINKTQEDTLSSYPITITQSNSDMMSMMMSIFTQKNEVIHENDAVYGGDTMSGLFETASKQLSKMNDLDAFKEYLEAHKSELGDNLSAIQYTYELGLASGSSLGSMGTGGTSTSSLLSVHLPNGYEVKPDSKALYDLIIMYAVVYLESEFPMQVEVSGENFNVVVTDATDKKYSPDYARGFLCQYIELAKTSITNADEKKMSVMTQNKVDLTKTEFNAIIGKAMGLNIDSYREMNLNVFTEMIDNETLLKSQYQLLGDNSKWATESNETMLILNSNSELDDYILYALGLYSTEDMNNHLKSIFTENKSVIKIDYNEVLGKEFKILLNTDYYVDLDNTGTLTDIRTLLKSNDESDKQRYETEFNKLLNDSSKGKTIKIVGVARLNDNTTAGPLNTGICYTSKLTNELIDLYNNSSVVTNGTVASISKTPVSISFYASTFEAKEEIENFIKKYNEGVEEEKKIEYTDYVGLMMGAISTIISAISYVLIAFVSVSLVVSSIMIGIITYISVLERIKEIGILRAVGASKRDIKRVFTAETLIIGLIAGLIGVLFAGICTIPINIIINNLADIQNVASLPILGAVILVAISMFLTLIAGLIPAQIASKKDPVIALRSE